MTTIDNYRITGLTAAKALTNNAGTIVKTQLVFANGVDFKNDVTNISWEGDSQKVKLAVLNAIDLTAAIDYLMIKALKTIYGLTEVATLTGAYTDEAYRVYFGATADQVGVVAGIEMLCNAVRLDTAVNKVIKVSIPQAQWSPVDFAKLATSGKTGTTIAISSLKVATDIAATALQGVPTGGCHAYVSELV
jgi:hypothetical protein